MSYQSTETCKPPPRFEDEARRCRVGFLGLSSGLPPLVTVICTGGAVAGGTAVSRSPSVAAAALDVEPLGECRLADVARYRSAEAPNPATWRLMPVFYDLIPPLVE